MYKCQNSSCDKSHSSSRRSLCKTCFDNMSSQQNTSGTPTITNSTNSLFGASNFNDTLSTFASDLQNTHSGSQAQQHFQQHVSQQLSQANDNEGNEIREWIRDEDMANSNNYWHNMNKLLDAKFSHFEQTFKNTILTEVKQITEPIVKDVNDLKAENRELRTQMTTLKAKTKEQGEKLEKVEKALREHHKTLVRNDKDARSKRLILAGMPETRTVINDVEMNDDDSKVREIMRILDAGDLKVMNTRRIGNKDQGTDNRPRYILIEFSCFKDRNYVKKNSAKLKDRDDTKTLFLKADSTKKQREEYKRLYDLKKQNEQEDPQKAVRIDYGKLYVDDTIIDQVATDNGDFL